MMNDAQLLREFNRHGSESAFRALIDRHLSLVFGTARRMTGDPALAEEIAQTAFILLARKARSLGPGTILSGWLYRTTRFVAARALQSEQRRRRREQEAALMQTHTDSDDHWQRLAPNLDEAMGRLGQTDRNALLLRFFEERPLREVGDSLGVTEEAAKKRVARALEKLKRILQRRGTEISVTALAAGLAREATAAVAANLAGRIASIAVTQSAAAGGSALLAEVLAAWRWSRFKAALWAGGGAVAVVLLLPLVIPRSGDAVARLAESPAARAVQAQAVAQSNASSVQTGASEPMTVTFGGATVPAHGLRLTVLEAESGEPIAGAGVTHYLMQRMGGGTMPEPFRTDTNGVVVLRIPKRLPDDERMDQFGVIVQATNWAPRVINWMSATGSVLSIVSTQYTVRLESGITLSGTVVDEAGDGIPGVSVHAYGSNHRGYGMGTKEARVQDYSSFGTGVMTDRRGRFQFVDFPADMPGIAIQLLAPDGSRHGYRTPEGELLSADKMEEVAFNDLRLGTAWLVLRRGVTVQGVVVDAEGNWVQGVSVLEGIQYGNLKVQSRSDTDYFGRFTLSNRPIREVILAASAAGFATASSAVMVQPGMGEVVIRLQPERPLRGRVVNEAGDPVPGARVNVPDWVNLGTGFEWSGQTDGEGRFVWPGAPTNDVTLGVEAEGYQWRIVPVRRSTNEVVVTIGTKPQTTVRVTGKVTDESTGQPVEEFTVKVSHGAMMSLPEPAKRSVKGRRGEFVVEPSKKDVQIGMHTAYVLTVEADKYEPVVTRFYQFEEGDQQVDISLTPGGTIEGRVLTPDGHVAAEAQLAFARSNDPLNSHKPGELSRSAREAAVRSDAEGRFRLPKPPGTRGMVVMHDTGWAILTPGKGMRTLDVSLQPWARIEGVVLRAGTPAAGERVGLNRLTWLWTETLTTDYFATTDREGRFVFDKVPGGEFVVSVQANAWQRGGQLTTKAFETPVIVEAGETKSVRLGGQGRTAVARLQAKSFSTAPSWTTALAVLTSGAPAPPMPARSDYVLDTSYTAAVENWATNPALRELMRASRHFVGQVSKDGMARFDDIPPGQYVLEVKVFAPDVVKSPGARYGDQPVVGRLRASVSVPAPADTAAEGEVVALGEFRLEPL